MGQSVEDVHPSTMKEFQKYSWPGNVRELRNIIERNLIENTEPIFRAKIIELEQKSNCGMRRLKEVQAEHISSVLQACLPEKPRGL